MRPNSLIALSLGVVLTMSGWGVWSWPELADRVGELWTWSWSSGYKSESGNIHGPGGGATGYFYVGMWQVDPEPTELTHVVFFPKCVSYGLGASASFGSWGTSPIQSKPEGLYLDGVPVRLGPDRRVFVYSAKRRMLPVPLTAEQLEAFTPEAMGRLGETEAWPAILAILDEERVCCGCPAPPEPVQAPKPGQVRRSNALERRFEGRRPPVRR